MRRFFIVNFLECSAVILVRCSICSSQVQLEVIEEKLFRQMVVKVPVTILIKDEWKSSCTKNVESFPMFDEVRKLATKRDRACFEAFSKEIEMQAVESDVNLVVAN